MNEKDVLRIVRNEISERECASSVRWLDGLLFFSVGGLFFFLGAFMGGVLW